MNALDGFGFGSLELKAKDFFESDQIIQLGGMAKTVPSDSF